MREEVILSETRLWPLLPLVKVSCSDDETDSETSADSSGRKRPLHVRKLDWRSPELEEIWKRVDSRKDRIRSSLPGNSQSSTGKRLSTPSRQSRPRVRLTNAPLSKIEPPIGLSKDCYRQSWLDGLEPGNLVQTQLIAPPSLPGIIHVLDELGF